MQSSKRINKHWYTRLIDGDLDILSKNLILSKSLNKLLGGFVEDVLKLLSDSDLRDISFDEFMLFVSAINCGTDFEKDIHECKNLIKACYRLSRVQKILLLIP